MTKAEKRILEIWFHHFYMWYTQNNTRHTYNHFLMLPHFLQTNYNYDEDLIRACWTEHLLSNPTPPSEDESLLAMIHKSQIIKCSTSMFSPFYKLKGKERRIKINTFRTLKIQLTPKIQHETFHEHLLTYLLQLCYTFSNLGGMVNVQQK